MKITLLRHCEIESGNQYNSDFVLSDYGLRQASGLPYELTEQYTAIYSSPLIRAIETACHMARKNKIGVSIVDGLGDIAYKGRSFDDVRPLCWLAYNEILNVHKDNKDANILIVTHGFPIQVIVSKSIGCEENQINCNRGRYIKLETVGNNERV